MVYLGHIYSSSLTWAFAARAPCSTFALLEEESAQEQTPPCDMPVRGSIWKQNSAPLPFCWVKKSLLPKHCCPQTQLSVKGAFKWRKFSLISAHRYYAETPDEVNILTSFLKRIWVQLSESFSELKIGWFLWHLDQKIILTLTVNFYCTRIGGQFDTCITSVFNVTHGPIQLAKSATVCFTSNLAGIFIGSFSSCSPQMRHLRHGIPC